MKTLENNIINIFADKGRAWLDSLPSVVAKLADSWQLSEISPVDNMTYNYVAKAVQTHNLNLPLDKGKNKGIDKNSSKDKTIDNIKSAVVLKISCTNEMIADEIKALNHFDGHAAIKLLAVNNEFNAILLEQAIPGESLKSIYPSQMQAVIDNYVEVAKRLSIIPIPLNNEFSHISDWLSAIDRADKSFFSDAGAEHLLQTAIRLKNELLETNTHDYILHGYLHHDNIIINSNQAPNQASKSSSKPSLKPSLNHEPSLDLKNSASHFNDSILNSGDWLCIDPKGVTGNIEFEVAAFISGNIETKTKYSYQEIISMLADKLNIDAQRLTAWVFVRAILSVAWTIVDNCDPAPMLAFANNIYKILPLRKFTN